VSDADFALVHPEQSYISNISSIDSSVGTPVSVRRPIGSPVRTPVSVRRPIFNTPVGSPTRHNQNTRNFTTPPRLERQRNQAFYSQGLPDFLGEPRPVSPSRIASSSLFEEQQTSPPRMMRTLPVSELSLIIANKLTKLSNPKKRGYFRQMIQLEHETKLPDIEVLEHVIKHLLKYKYEHPIGKINDADKIKQLVSDSNMREDDNMREDSNTEEDKLRMYNLLNNKIFLKIFDEEFHAPITTGGRKCSRKTMKKNKK